MLQDHSPSRNTETTPTSRTLDAPADLYQSLKRDPSKYWNLATSAEQIAIAEYLARTFFQEHDLRDPDMADVLQFIIQHGSDDCERAMRPYLPDPAAADLLDDAPVIRGVDPYKVTRTRIKWLADDEQWGVPRAYLTRLVGEPDVGKSQLCLYLAALEGKAGGYTLYFAREDGISDVISQRTEAAGVPPGTVEVVDYDADGGAELLGRDMPELERSIRDTGATLVILDPVQEYTSERTDGVKQSDVRAVLKRLRAVAQSTGAAIVFIQHEGKGHRRSKNDVGIGSKDWDAGVRSTLYAGKVGGEDEKNPKFAVGNTKLNIRRKSPPRVYTIEDRLVGQGDESYQTSRVLMGDTSPDVDMEAIINRDMGAGQHDSEEKSRLQETAEWLEEALPFDVPVGVADLKKSASSDGFGWRTIERAKGLVEGDISWLRGTHSNPRAYAWVRRSANHPNGENLADLGGPFHPHKISSERSAKVRQQKDMADLADPKTSQSDTHIPAVEQEAPTPEKEICFHERKVQLSAGVREKWFCPSCGKIRGGGHSRWRLDPDTIMDYVEGAIDLPGIARRNGIEPGGEDYERKRTAIRHQLAAEVIG